MLRLNHGFACLANDMRICYVAERNFSYLDFFKKKAVLERYHERLLYSLDRDATIIIHVQTDETC